MSWKALIDGALGSAIITVFYGIFIAQREERIRGYLSVKRNAWLRRRYVRAFVRALRGHAAAADASILRILVLAIPLAAGAYAWSSAANMETSVRDLGSRLSDAAQEIRGSKVPTRESLEAQITHLQGKMDAVARSAREFEVASRAFAVLLFVGVLYGFLFWLPFAAVSRQFECEIDRFALRIQGLATETELRDFATAESEVVDEDSLRAFFEVAAAIAAQHDLSRLAERFDLWAGE